MAYSSASAIITMRDCDPHDLDANVAGRVLRVVKATAGLCLFISYKGQIGTLGSGTMFRWAGRCRETAS